MSAEDIHGAAAEVIADLGTGKVVTRFFHPDTGETVLELHLDPDVSRDYALNLSSAAIVVEESGQPDPLH
jgi:hypothetical protein